MTPHRRRLILFAALGVPILVGAIGWSTRSTLYVYLYCHEHRFEEVVHGNRVAGSFRLDPMGNPHGPYSCWYASTGTLRRHTVYQHGVVLFSTVWRESGAVRFQLRSSPSGDGWVREEKRAPPWWRGEVDETTASAPWRARGQSIRAWIQQVDAP